MKEYKVYAKAIIFHKHNKKFGGVIFTFNENDANGKRYLIEEEDYNSKFLSEILNDVFLHDSKDFQVYLKHIMPKLRLTDKQKEVYEK